MTKYFVVDLKRDMSGPFDTRAEVEDSLKTLRAKFPFDTLAIETRVTVDDHGTGVGRNEKANEVTGVWVKVYKFP